jgi:dUTP pyrophosphatase
LITYTVKIKPTVADVELPSFQSRGAAAMDIRVAHPVLLPPMETRSVSCGFAMELPVGMEAQIRPRSGMSRDGILVHFGTIDSDYRGEIEVILTNLSGKGVTIKKNERIAQMAIATSHTSLARFSVVEHLSETKRGESGFGSTGRT